MAWKPPSGSQHPPAAGAHMGDKRKEQSGGHMAGSQKIHDSLKKNAKK